MAGRGGAAATQHPPPEREASGPPAADQRHLSALAGLEHAAGTPRPSPACRSRPTPHRPGRSDRFPRAPDTLPPRRVCSRAVAGITAVVHYSWGFLFSQGIR